jgi:hypothetical protein
MASRAKKVLANEGELLGSYIQIKLHIRYSPPDASNDLISRKIKVRIFVKEYVKEPDCWRLTKTE